MNTITGTIPRAIERGSVVRQKWARGRLGHYRLCAEVARGGMSTIYLALDESRPGIQGVVAVKQLDSHLACEAQFREMFRDEAELVSQIRHANVCAVLDYQVDDEACFMVLEYLVGEPLSAVRRAAARIDRPGDVHAALVARVIADACEGLHAAHRLRDVEGQPLKIVHRDVSPDNVFLGFDGHPKIIDFGVARSSLQRHHTKTGIMKGKLSYLQPEVLSGEPCDRRADVWGLGVVLWELLTGKRLFQRTTDVSTMRAILDTPIPTPSSVRPDLPPQYDDVVMRALERDPERRYRSARELARALTKASARSGHAIALRDVAEWMDAMFPKARAHKRELVRMIQRMESEPPTELYVAAMCRASAAEERSSADEVEHATCLSPRARKLPRPDRVRGFGRQALAAVAALLLGGSAFAAGAWQAKKGQEPIAAVTAAAARTSTPAPAAAAPGIGYVLELWDTRESRPHRIKLLAPPGVKLQSADPALQVTSMSPEGAEGAR